MTKLGSKEETDVIESLFMNSEDFNGLWLIKDNVASRLVNEYSQILDNLENL